MLENELQKEDLTEKELAILDREYNMLKKDLNIAYLLCVFTGLFGIHKFYLGKIGMGVAYFFTGGLLLIGLLYDLVTLPQQVYEYNSQLEYDIIQRILRFRQRRDKPSQE